MRLAARSRLSTIGSPLSALGTMLLGCWGLWSGPRTLAQASPAPRPTRLASAVFAPSLPLETHSMPGAAPGSRGCPKAIAPLVDQLLADLPSYTNRVIQRQRVAGPPARLYIMVAGAAEIEPWPAAWPPASSRPLPPPAPGQSTTAPARYQVFFTTLERQYIQPQGPAPESPSQQSQSFQQLHWLILSQPGSPTLPPWQLLSLRSQLAPYTAPDAASATLLSPPREAHQGAIAQAIALWLRDCSALERTYAKPSSPGV